MTNTILVECFSLFSSSWKWRVLTITIFRLRFFCLFPISSIWHVWFECVWISWVTVFFYLKCPICSENGFGHFLSSCVFYFRSISEPLFQSAHFSILSDTKTQKVCENVIYCRSKWLQKGNTSNFKIGSNLELQN